MTKDEMKVFKRAEELLAKIQHHNLLPLQDVREALRREIRAYFSSHERGVIIEQERYANSPHCACGEVEPTPADHCCFATYKY